MMNIEICKLKTEADLDLLAKEYSNYYNNSVLGENWTIASAKQLVKYFYNHAPQDLFLVAYDQNKPIGVIMSLLKPWWDGMHLEDTELFVCKDYQKQGIAKRLLKTLFTYAIENYNATILETHTYEDETGFPYCWYIKLGFVKIDDWKIIKGNIQEIVHKL